ncbi:uncharacterized protein LOC107710293 [Sinocyclocheilus rhinocerous]|uniref:uncharacterized protein LOC107710293 n=1 Tax=Sinocyclocheilus rhinocerous TaxID=307959 RepID=UPI0007BACD36|nr:PREDICTED: uncharacterized protein LOC107710293 [Sinocyclocheilus rhinocerous]
MSVIKGEHVTLDPDLTQLQRDEMLLWGFGDINVLLAKIDLETQEISLKNTDERFRDRLQVDHQTGSLTITNTKTTDSGLYKLQIRGSESSQRFILTVNDSGLSPPAVAGIVVGGGVVVLLVAAAAAGVIYYRKISELQKQRSVMISVEEGEHATLNHANKIQKDDLILWMFGDENKLIAQMMGQTREITYPDAGKRFINALQLDKTGSLTIKSITNEQAGNYKLQICNSRRTIENQFCVDVRGE